MLPLCTLLIAFTKSRQHDATVLLWRRQRVPAISSCHHDACSALAHAGKCVTNHPFFKSNSAQCTLGPLLALLGAAVQRCHGSRVPSRFLGLVGHAKPVPGTRCIRVCVLCVWRLCDRWRVAAGLRDILPCTVNQFSKGLTRQARGYGVAALWPVLEAPFCEQVSISLYTERHTGAFLSLETSCDVHCM